MGWCGLDWLLSGRDRWRVLVNTVMNLQFPYNAGTSYVATQPAASRERLSSTELVIS
jgi:hypothetical protein